MFSESRVRLTSGPNRYEGFPELWYRARWSTACDLGTFQDENGTIVTKDAGAGTAGMFWVFLLLPFPTKYINHFDKLDSDLTD